jgi:hypothetical protein
MNEWKTGAETLRAILRSEVQLWAKKNEWTRDPRSVKLESAAYCLQNLEPSEALQVLAKLTEVFQSIQAEEALVHESANNQITA